MNHLHWLGDEELVDQLFKRQIRYFKVEDQKIKSN